MPKRTIEEKVVGAFIIFANQRSCDYKIDAEYSISNNPIKTVELKLHPGYKPKCPVFNHCLTLNTNGDTLFKEKTLWVGTSTHQRKTYLEFIDYVKKKEGIELHNSFKELWENHHDKYPIS